MTGKNNSFDLNNLLAQVETEVKVGEVVELPLGEIRPNPYQPRYVFDEQALQELADSIVKQGVFQPIIVRGSQIQGYEIIAGERRFRASKLAGKTSIPAIVKEFTTNEMMEIAILENLQREDLTPLEEAQAYASLIEKLGLTQAEIAQRLGKSRPYIANYLRLLALPEEVKELVQAQQLSMGQARTLLGLKNKEQVIDVAHQTLNDNLTVRQLEQLVQVLNAGATAKNGVKRKPKNQQDIYYQAIEEQLQDYLGTKVTIKGQSHSKKHKNKQSQSGKIEIAFTSVQDLNRLLEILGIIND